MEVRSGEIELAHWPTRNWPTRNWPKYIYLFSLLLLLLKMVITLNQNVNGLNPTAWSISSAEEGFS